jgi:hypothetical protein
MARTDRTPDDKGKVKFRFVEFELEGLNSTIEESIKNIVHSMSRSSTIPTRVLSAKPAVSAALPQADGNGNENLDPEQEGALEAESAEDGVQASAPGRPKNLRRYTVPNFLSDLDLDSGDVPFKAFVEQQTPNSDNRRYIVIAAWLKKHRATDTISTDHIYTCNQKMGWKTQKDVGQPFRCMKKQSYFDPAGRNQWKITHIGLDLLNTAKKEQQ